MIPYRCYLALFTCFTCLGVVNNPAKSFAEKPESDTIAPLVITSSVSLSTPLAVAPATSPPEVSLLLKMDSQGPEVKKLQTKLKELGYYDGVIDGIYAEKTKIAVSKFQKSVNLPSDGIVGKITWNQLQNTLPTPQKPSQPQPPPLISKYRPPFQLFWLVLGIFLVTSGLTGGIFFLRKALIKSKEDTELDSSITKLLAETIVGSHHITNGLENNHTQKNTDHNLTEHNSSQRLSPSPSEDNLVNTDPSRLLKIDIVDELIKDLKSLDLAKRGKAIWELAQRGDSRALPPLVDMMIDANSQQRSLILQALSQICIRTLKPINRAFRLSLQDENSIVRKNAIRDVTQIYELVGQVMQLLRHAVNDPDAEVQQTAHWAINQLNNISTSSAIDDLPTVPDLGNSIHNSQS